LSSLPDNSVKLAFFDPQYSKVKDVIRVHQAPMIYQDAEQIQEFLREIGRVLKPSGFCLLWIAKKQVLNAQPINLPANLKVVDFLVWDKSPGLLLGS
jgi:site-specific DNA-methyltransferase (adenine-specific)